ncbi:hypothetical protein GVAV_001346 [Gurleya vavrai]
MDREANPSASGSEPKHDATAYNDLASAVNAVKDFHGNEGEDVFSWERQLQTICTIFQLSEKFKMKLIFSKLKGKSQEWATNAMQQNPWYDVKDIIKNLKKQFSNTNSNHNKLNHFLSIKNVNSKEEFTDLLNIANEIYQRGSVNEESLIKLTIARCPSILRPLLVKYTVNDGEWYTFLRDAQENMWIAFTDEIKTTEKEFMANEQIFAIKKKYTSKEDSF